MVKQHELRLAEEVRELSDLRVAVVQEWVDEQLRHPDSSIVAAAERTLAGDLAVWELVDLVLAHAKIETAAAGMVKLLDELPADDVAELRRSAGADADGLRALVNPDPEQIPAEAKYHLARLGVFEPAAQQWTADELARRFNTDGLAERLPGGRRSTAEEQDSSAAAPRRLDPNDPTNPFSS